MDETTRAQIGESARADLFHSHSTKYFREPDRMSEMRGPIQVALNRLIVAFALGYTLLVITYIASLVYVINSLAK